MSTTEIKEQSQGNKATASTPKVKGSRKKIKRQVVEGIVHIQATFNNTLITITDRHGGAIAWSSSARCGFRGSRKSTPYAAQIAADTAAKEAVERYGLRSVDVKVKGPGPGRESAIRALQAVSLKVLSIEDVTGIPFNGCRQQKKRRV
jgi:small subunit ribosomal protein S11